MRRIACCFVLLLLLCGCGQAMRFGTTVPTDSGHDHHAPQMRNRQSFFVETVQHEGTDYYLAYREMDGCTTRVGLLCSGQEKPNLFCHDGVFYYFTGYYDAARMESTGTINSIRFTGEVAGLSWEDGLRPSAIIRVDDTGVYCEAEDGVSYMRAELDLSSCEIVSAEAALNSNHK